MKYKVGDKVRVRKYLEVGSLYGEESFQASMKEYSGKIMTVDKIVSTGYMLKEDNDYYNWTDEMLEDVETLEGAEGITILVKDNKVIAKRDNKVGIAKCSPEDEFDIFTGAKIAIERLEEECKPYGWLKEGMSYYLPVVANDQMFRCTTYHNDTIDERMISRGLVFRTKEEAIEAAKKMLSVLKDD